MRAHRRLIACAAVDIAKFPPAKVGELGVGAPADGVHRTPVRTFTFDQAFGRQPDPGIKMPYFQATDQDWWDEDAGSPTYNTHVRRSGSPSSIAENLYDSGPDYDYAVNIAANPQRIPGRVAGIFLHVTDGNPTWGCVAIGRNETRGTADRALQGPHDSRRASLSTGHGTTQQISALRWGSRMSKRSSFVARID